jgi:hypothetical protein
MPIVELPDHGLSNSKARSSKHWIKQLAYVDRTARTGYAFVGTFHKFNATVEADEGTYFLSYVEDKSSSGRLYGRDVVLYRVAGNQLVKVQEWRLDGSDGWALKVRDQIADLIAPIVPDVDTLKAERVTLLARLQEIAIQLGEE